MVGQCFNRHPANNSGMCSNPTCVYRAGNRHTPVASPPETEVQTTNNSENWWDNDHDIPAS
jgi:hypothetical protein